MATSQTARGPESGVGGKRDESNRSSGHSDSGRSAEDRGGYLFAYFTGTEQKSTDEQIYFSMSRNGVKWTDLSTDGHPILTSEIGEKGVRDPFLVRKHGQKNPENGNNGNGNDGNGSDSSGAYLIATDLSIYHRGGWQHGNPAVVGDGSHNIIVWESSDLVHWSKPWTVDLTDGIDSPHMVWAPEGWWDADRQQYLVYWATIANDPHQFGDPTNMYCATTKDFRHFSTPKVWIDRPQSVIDTTMLQADDGWFYRVSADVYLGVERTKNPYACTRIDSGDGYDHRDDPNQWEFVGYFNELVGNPKWTGKFLEGPELFRWNPEDENQFGARLPYGLMWDQYAEGKGYLPFATADLGSTNQFDWIEAPINLGPLKKRHGTILPINATELHDLAHAYGLKQ